MPIEADISRGIEVDRSAVRRDRHGAEDLRWWLAPEDELHERVWAVTRRMMQHGRRRELRNFTYDLMYNDVDAHSLYRRTHRLALAPAGAGAIKLNVVQNAIDSAGAQIAKNRPRPMFLTNGGEYADFAKAEALTRYIGGVFADVDLYPKAQKGFTFAAISGLGGVRFWGDPDAGRVCGETISPREILVDELDGIDEKPRQLHLRRYVSRDVLAEMYPDAAEEIELVKSDLGAGALAESVGDMIPVVESWHLRSGPKATDGLHSIVVESVTLLVEEYKRDRYPIVFFRWYPMTSGFWGRGIVQSIEGIQRSIDRTLRNIDEAQDLFGSPYWTVPLGANVRWDQLLSNEFGRAIEYAGEQPPAPVAPPIFAPEIYQHVWNLEQRAYQIVGIAQNMAQAEKPAGLESGAAIREVADIAGGRMQQVGQRWEAFFTECADLVVELSKELYESDKNLRIQAKDEDALELIEWADVDMDRDRYRIEVFEVSALSTTPQGRLSQVTEWMQAGWIPKEIAMSLLNIPDLKRFSNLETSTIDLVQKTVGRIKRDGVYTAEMKPPSQLNLNLAMQVGTMEKVRACMQSLPVETLAKLDAYLSDLNDLMSQQAPPPQPPPPPGGPPSPQGPPMPVGAPPPPMPAMPQAM